MSSLRITNPSHWILAGRNRKQFRFGFPMVLLLISIHLPGCFREEIAPPTVTKQQKKEPQDNTAKVIVDSGAETVTVFTADGKRKVFRNAAFGVAGVREKVRRGDDVTPIGVFHVTRISYQSKYHVFIGLNYPRVEDAERGLRGGLIDEATFNRIIRAHKRGEIPPQETLLGGDLGIHGIGRGSPDIHEIANWTAGCIALTNEQVRELAKLVTPGMRVEIR